MAPVPSKVRRKLEWLFLRAEGAFLDDAVLTAEGAHLEPLEARARLREGKENEEALRALEWLGRLEHLERALDGDAERRRTYLEQYGAVGVQRFRAGTETRIYCLSVETFPRHINNVYVVLEPGSALMLDCGSDLPTSRRDLALGFAVVRALFHEDVRYEALDWCVISHAHYDHFGGANAIKRETRAHLAVHELDARVLSGFDERLVVVSKDIDVYLRRAGIDDEKRAELLALYTAHKTMFAAVKVDRVLRDGDQIGPGYRVHHVPGHCPGLICLQVHDVLLTSDHVLARITPHQFPQAITPFAGLEHFFHSLAKIRKVEGINYALGGHEEPIWDLRARIDGIANFHRQRLGRVLEVCDVPRTVLGVADALFGPQEGYGFLLAIEEAGAHVEYLHNLGKLRIANLDEVATSRDPVIEYVVRK
ncbi:MBL fold metallo-hydrolase [Pendulispora albinea]|uniref:MBL fold metallo-hydrolase n=1 Tax=Pendulispora albinea TaxID=2741071 RepID=A0ABZ2LKX8_9BACT